jgi:hypothetical protein
MSTLLCPRLPFLSKRVNSTSLGGALGIQNASNGSLRAMHTAEREVCLRIVFRLESKTIKRIAKTRHRYATNGGGRKGSWSGIALFHFIP